MTSGNNRRPCWPRPFSQVAVIATMLLAAAGSNAVAQRPSAMKLFPEETVVFVRIANAHEFGQRLRETATGRMIRDPQLQPLVEQLYGEAGRLYAEEAEDKLGISWDDLRKLPRGEVAIGVVARPNAGPAFLALIDQGDEPSVAENLVDRAVELAEEKGAELSTEKIGDVEVTVMKDPDRPDRTLGLFERENTIVAATDPDLLRHVLWYWDGKGERGVASVAAATRADSDGRNVDETQQADIEENEFIPGRTLAENDRFTTIVRNCRRPQDPPPQMLFFVDPVELARSIGHDSEGLQMAMGMLPMLGLDGLHAIGAAVTFAAGEYDDLSQFHLLLENPRAGVLQLPAFEPGDTTPQEFVPYEVETYTTGHWQVRTSYDRLAAMLDQFRGEATAEKLVERRLSEPLGIDFTREVIDNLAGRFTWLIGYEKPAHFRGQRHVLAAELRDEAAALETLNAVMAKFPDQFEERRFGSVTYYAITPEKLMEMDEAQRPIDPFIAVLDGYVFIGGSCQLFERCVAARDGTVERLVDSADYARTAEVLGREAAGATPALFSISRFEETVLQWYGLLTSERTRELLDEHKEGNRFLAALAGALDEHQLPPFEALAPYLSPSGAVLYDTDTGYHGISFTLRNEAQP